MSKIPKVDLTRSFKLGSTAHETSKNIAHAAACYGFNKGPDPTHGMGHISKKMKKLPDCK